MAMSNYLQRNINCICPHDEELRAETESQKAINFYSRRRKRTRNYNGSYI
ncbi:hypothetical protein ANACAC_02201 [Anaerostipes caccae L1-92]|uniref:Uncharacterized protein n=1 Tax=Anaerostipes caccae (strain DSM 14662 / CCUG 47493 / JCM 13470 / NCIMB 13811 / L1-92) TaxID=411490 RepID=B0MFV1_ANACD|nr:hypothetical protein ANACAC_02201 [Anaerostipes caccae L1-92]